MQITLPWPGRELSPNSRVHWAAKAKVAKSYRKTAWALSRHARRHLADGLPVKVSIEFCPPDKRGRDLDNCLASLKSGLDGVADALQVNDRDFWLALRWGAPVKGGLVRIELSQ